MLHATHPAVLFLAGGYVLWLVLGVLFLRERRHVRDDFQAVGILWKQAIGYVDEQATAAATKTARAEVAVDAVAEFFTASFANAPVRQRIRDELKRLAFEEPELFRCALQSEPAPAPRLLPRWHPLPEMPLPFDQFEALQDWHVPALRARLRKLNNSGFLPEGTVSGTEISTLNRRDLIALLLRYDPQFASFAAAA